MFLYIRIKRLGHIGLKMTNLEKDRIENYIDISLSPYVSKIVNQSTEDMGFYQDHMSGTLTFIDGKTGKTLFATLFWDGSENIPICVTEPNCSTTQYTVDYIDFPYSKITFNKSKDFRMYIETIGEVLREIRK